MKWDLFVSDIFARIMGVIGLVAAMPWIVYCFTLTKFTGLEIDFPTAFGVSSFLVVFALLFLLPNVHDRFMRVTRPALLRFIVAILALAWVIIAVFGLRDQYLLAQALQAPEVTTYALLAMAVALCAAVLVLITPFGLAWREPRREYEARRLAQVQAAPERTPFTQSIELRDRDLFDHLLWLPFYGLGLTCLYGMFVGATAINPDWSAQIAGAWPIGSAIVFTVVLLPALVVGLIRGPVRNARRPHQRPPHFMVQVFAGAIMSVALYFATAFIGLPATAHFVLDAPQETRTYTVSDMGSSRRTRHCMTVVPSSAPETSAWVCDISGDIVGGLRVGHVIEVTGPLTAFGHRFEDVRVMQ